MLISVGIPIECNVFIRYALNNTVALLRTKPLHRQLLFKRYYTNTQMTTKGLCWPFWFEDRLIKILSKAWSSLYHKQFEYCLHKFH